MRNGRRCADRREWTQIRDERKQAVVDHVKSVEAMLKEAQVAGLGSGDEGDDAENGPENGDEEWGGFEDAAPAPAVALEPVDREEEYIDEDLYTTVKVEAVSVDRDGLHNKAELEAEDEDAEDEAEGAGENKKESREDGGKKSWKDQPKKKKKKFRYGTKLERQATNRKNNAGKGRRKP